MFYESPMTLFRRKSISAASVERNYPPTLVEGLGRIGLRVWAGVESFPPIPLDGSTLIIPHPPTSPPERGRVGRSRDVTPPRKTIPRALASTEGPMAVGSSASPIHHHLFSSSASSPLSKTSMDTRVC
ncbi:hypothetical protein JTE90_016566 [Oedothorax gibbosus]|uniref:Uncharacterized protein n=1 Tax=Oedothorax gibbosus TaxID=931172 RepID=A0AAV6UC98_9ARAC|nr:hypothetical protein JTE90_016566 [Oedothorax gibbosus]